MTKTPEAPTPTPAAPTEQLVTPVNPAAAEIQLDPAKDPFEQLKADAEQRGRPDMVGLEWKDEETGLSYRVSNYQELRTVRSEPKKTSLPRLLIRGNVGGGGAIERVNRKDKSYTSRTYTTEYRTVDVLNNKGELVDILQIAGKERLPVKRVSYFGKPRKTRRYEEFDRFPKIFYKDARSNPNAKGSDVQVPRKLTNVRWAKKEAPKHTRYEQFPAQVSDQTMAEAEKRGEKVTWLAAIDEDRMRQELGWPGLTWTDQAGHEKKIVRQEVVTRKDPVTGQEYPDLIFEVRTRAKRSGDSPEMQTYHLYSAKDMERHFSDRKLHKKRPPLAMHWEYGPESELERWHWCEQEAWTNWGPPNRLNESKKPAHEQLLLFDVQGRPVPYPDSSEKNEAGDDMSLDNAYESLGGHELSRRYGVEDSATFLERVDNLKKDSGMKPYAEALVALAADIGHNKLNEILVGLHNEYYTDLQRLGIPFEEQELSTLSGILKDMLDPFVQGVGNPFEDSPAGKHLRDRTISLMLGRKFWEASTVDQKARMKDWDGEEPTEKTIHVYQQNPAMTGKLRALIHGAQIDTIMKERRTSKGRELTDDDLVDDWVTIGRLLRHSFGRS